MKKIIIAVIALVLLGAGGAGAYFYFAKPAEAAGTEVAEPVKAEDEHAAPVPTNEFVNMDAILLPIIDEKGVSQVVSLVLTLDVPDVAAVEHARRLSPRLKDAIIQDMYGVLSRKASMNSGVLEVQKVKARLNILAKKVLGEDKVNDVLLQVVNQKRV